MRPCPPIACVVRANAVALAIALLAIAPPAAGQEPAAEVKVLYRNALDSLPGLELWARVKEIAQLPDGPALQLDGAAFVPGIQLGDGAVEVEILAQAAAYPGILFRAVNAGNSELAYAVPQVSGQADALQYDPLMNRSNTWQIFHGPAYQKAVEVPTGRWFRLRVDFTGNRAAVRVDDQPPLVVERLARDPRAGRVGLWTFKPAYFRNLRVLAAAALPQQAGVPATAPAGAITSWRLADRVLPAEPNGVLAVNRFLTPDLTPARVTRRFTLPAAAEVTFELGFSDTLSLKLDGEEIYAGTNTFSGFTDEATRGWARPGSVTVRRSVAAGEHQLEATVGLIEPFGWGLAVALQGEGVRLLEP